MYAVLLNWTRPLTLGGNLIHHASADDDEMFSPCNPDESSLKLTDLGWMVFRQKGKTTLSLPF